MGLSGTNFRANLPILDGKNWKRWKVQMKAIMGYQDVDNILEQGYPTIDERTTNEQRRAYKANNKKDCKGYEKLKKVRLQTLTRQYELMQMEANEKVGHFFNRIVTHMNAMKAYGEKITNQSVSEKILRTLTPNFDHIVVVIEESKNLEMLKIEDLQGSLEAYEQRLNERSNHMQKELWRKEWISRKGQGEFQRKKTRCFNCDKIDYFTTECKSPSTQDDNKSKQHSEAHMAKEEIEAGNDEQPLLLMMVTNQ
ncbi:PREDICTED: uncharacterized protein LOC109337347, partial [Lupinus angustifolius]|uniref:uncharacterized protein LOC109337347 n=1 Tax=Lupinus angustifolius TaxID=3871 RepID=UPI00092EDBAA